MKLICRTFLLSLTTFLLCVPSAWAGDKGPKNEKFILKLTSPISTATSKAGDQFTAIVVEPEAYRDGIVEGHIRKAEPAANMEKPKARLLFDFDTLTTGDTTYKIQADMQEVSNSKGMAKVDEEGQVIAKGNGGKRAMGAFGGAGIGALAGGMLGGGLGSLAGGAIGGLAGYMITLDVTSSSKNIEFFPGTQFTVLVTSKGTDSGVNADKIRADEKASELAMASAAPVAAPVTTDASAAPAANGAPAVPAAPAADPAPVSTPATAPSTDAAIAKPSPSSLR